MEKTATTEGPAERIGRFARARRPASSMTQQELALVAGVGRRFVSELENGKLTLHPAQVDTALRVFGRQLGIVALERTPASDD